MDWNCFVTAGVSLNVMSHGVVVGYTTDLLMELKTSQDIPITKETASWIASAPEMALVVSTLIVPIIIKKCGRRLTNLISAIIITAAWFGFVVCTNVTTMLILRVLKGLALGFTGFLGAVMIGEYTTPRLRGAFLTTVFVSIIFGIFISQALGTILSWKHAASVYGAVGLLDIMIIYWSPETPSYLAFQHKYDECRKVFRWIRGFDEEEELEKMIKTSKLDEEARALEQKAKLSFKVKISRTINTVKNKEFYQTILIIMSLYVWSMWTGCVAVNTYADEFYHGILGPDINFALMIITVGLQTVISNILGVILYRYMKRRHIFLISTLLMAFTLFAIGLYVYGKTHKLLPFDHPYLGAVLLHVQMFTNAAIMGPIPNVLMGEIIPLRYREICGTISLLFCSANVAFILKTVPFLISSIGLHGTYFLYAGVVCMGFIYPWIQMPETKDRTLQEIEENIRGEPYNGTELTEPLSNNEDCNKIRLTN